MTALEEWVATTEADRALVLQLLDDGVGVTLDDLMARPPWQRDARCAEYPMALFFPERGASPEPARRICDGCLVLGSCRAWALEQGPDLVGVWGALSTLDRQRLREGKALPERGRGSFRTDGVHGTVTRYRQGCRCEPCRAANAARMRSWKAARAG